MSQVTTWINGRPFRNGFRVEGEFITRYYGKTHLFFKSQDEAMLFFRKEAESIDYTEKRSQ